jgi:hypothetical protein
VLMRLDHVASIVNANHSNDLYAVGLRKRARNTLCQWSRSVWIIDPNLLYDTTSELWLFAVPD